VQGLEKMAGLELRQTTRSVAENVDLRSVLEELRIVIEPSFLDSGMSIFWEVPDTLPQIWADRQALLQVFLNVVKNSQRAMEGQDQKNLTVRASADENYVVVWFIDTGPGVAHPEQLFEPFQPGAQASGLGLYLSRTFVRAFQGDIEYQPQPTGCCFAVTLALPSDHQPRTGEST
jgi:two-component system sensor kinase FixL